MVNIGNLNGDSKLDAPLIDIVEKLRNQLRETDRAANLIFTFPDFFTNKFSRL